MKIFICFFILTIQSKLYIKEIPDNEEGQRELVQNLKTMRLNDLNEFCNAHKQFCAKYHSEIYDEILRLEKEKEKTQILKIKDKIHQKILLRQLNSQGQPEDIDCNLSARILPLIFFGQTRSMQFGMNFNSNCLDSPLLMYFMVPWNKSKGLTLSEHPSFINLVLFGQNLDFKFSTPYSRGQQPHFNLAYQMVMMNPSRGGQSINTFLDNEKMIFDFQNPLNLTHINKLSGLTNPSECSVNNMGDIMTCLVNQIQ